jgi:hypothetical protein
MAAIDSYKGGGGQIWKFHHALYIYITGTYQYFPSHVMNIFYGIYNSYLSKTGIY